jgi:hypothetical protein
MRAAPIPKRFLPHSCTLLVETDSGAWGSTSAEEIDLQFVRIDKSQSEGKGSALMFYDCVNSTPCGVNFTLTGNNIKRVCVRIDDDEYVIKKVDYLYAEDSLHHLEIILETGG